MYVPWCLVQLHQFIVQPWSVLLSTKNCAMINRYVELCVYVRDLMEAKVITIRIFRCNKDNICFFFYIWCWIMLFIHLPLIQFYFQVVFAIQIVKTFYQRITLCNSFHLEEAICYYNINMLIKFPFRIRNDTQICNTGVHNSRQWP